MFKVQNLHTGQVRTVYAVNGHFFLFYEEGHWFYDDIGQYAPVEEQA